MLKGNLNETVNKIYLARKKTYSESDFRIKCNFETKENIIEKFSNYMRIQKIKVKSSNSILTIIGRNAIQFLSKEINAVCPKTKKLEL